MLKLLSQNTKIYKLPFLTNVQVMSSIVVTRAYVAQKMFITTQHGIGKNSKLTSLFHRIKQLSISMVG